MSIRLLIGLGLLIFTQAEAWCTEKEEQVPLQRRTSGETSFEDLPIELQALILADPKEYAQRFGIDKKSRRALSTYCLWASPRENLAIRLEEALDDQGQLIPSSVIATTLKSDAQNILIKRLVDLSSSSPNQAFKDNIRTVLTRHIVDNIFLTKDPMIEVSRKAAPKQAKALIHMARGNTAHRIPMVHSQQMPYAFQEKLDEAVLVETIATDTGTFRTWQLPGDTTLLGMMSTVSDGSEEYLIHRPIYVNGRIQTEFVQVLDNNSDVKDWPMQP